MKLFLLILLLSILFLSCSDKGELPPDVMPVNRMKTIVWDLEMAEQQAGDRFPIQQKDSLRMESTSLYQQVFAKHKINKPDFYKSFRFYESHPDLMKTLFDSVSNYGNRQKVSVFKKEY